MNDQNEEASSPTKLKLQYLIQKNTINFNSEEDVNVEFFSFCLDFRATKTTARFL